MEDADLEAVPREEAVADGDLPPPAGAAEWSAGAEHWALLLLLVAAGWWLLSRRRAPEGRPRPTVDPDEVRRKRLEAVAGRQPAAASGRPEPNGASAEAEDGLRRRHAPAAEPAAAGEAKAEVEAPATFSVKARGIVRGVTCIETVTGLRESMTVRELHDAIFAAFRLAPSEARLRVFSSKGQELERLDTSLKFGEVVPDSTLQVKFTFLSQAAASPASAPPRPPPAPQDQVEAAPSAVAAAAGAPSEARAPADLAVSALASADPEAAIAVRVQGTFHGKQRVVAIEGAAGLTGRSAVSELRRLVAEAFGAEGGQGLDGLRVFHMGKELKQVDAQLHEVGVKDGALITVLFKPAEVTGGDIGELVTIRVQGVLDGQQHAHTVDGLREGSTVAELEQRVAAAFAVSPGSMTMRLFYMGKELKGPGTRLRDAGLRAGAAGTVNAMLKPAAAAAGGAVCGQVSPQHTGAAAACGGSAAAAADAAELCGESCAPGAWEAETAPSAAHPATGSGAPAAIAPQLAQATAVPTALTPPAAPAPPGAPMPPSAEAAWRAMAEVQQHLAQADDPTVDEHVRHAALLLRGMLATATHESNPALLQFAQMANPQLAEIWGYLPTREHLLRLLSRHRPPAEATPLPPQGAAGAGPSDAGAAAPPE